MLSSSCFLLWKPPDQSWSNQTMWFWKVCMLAFYQLLELIAYHNIVLCTGSQRCVFFLRTVIPALFLLQPHQRKGWTLTNLLVLGSISSQRCALRCAPAHLPLSFFTRCSWTPVTAVSAGSHLMPIELPWISQQQVLANSSSWSSLKSREKVGARPTQEEYLVRL